MPAREEAWEAVRRMDYAMESKRLLVHAICESRRYAWRSGAGALACSTGRLEVLAQGQSPVDIVQQAITLTLEGRRPWDEEKYPDIASHLKWVIRSLVANLASSSDNKQLRHAAEGPAEEGFELPETRRLREAAAPEAEELSRRVLAAVQDDPQLVEVLEHLRAGHRPRQIAERMRLEEKDIYRLTQKLRRRLGAVLEPGGDDGR